MGKSLLSRDDQDQTIRQGRSCVRLKIIYEQDIDDFTKRKIRLFLDKLDTYTN